MIFCKNCGWQVEPIIKPRPDTPHAGSQHCPECNSFLGWAKKEKNEGKRGAQKFTPADLGIDYCQICRLKKNELGDHDTLDTHHLDGNSENNQRINLLVSCTSCHKLIHHQITYRNHFIEKQWRLYEEFKKVILPICPTNYDYEQIIKAYVDLYGL